MKLASLLLVLVTVTLGQHAFADDGGIMAIRVNSTNMTADSWDSKNMKQVQTPVNNPSYTINLTGGNAAKFMRILPPSLSVIATDPSKPFTQLYNANFRSLQIDAGNYSPIVSLYCAGGDLDFDHPTASGDPGFTEYSDGAHCSISIVPAPGADGQDGDIDYTYDPVKNSCQQ